MVPFQGNRYIALQNAFRMEYSLKKMEIFWQPSSFSNVISCIPTFSVLFTNAVLI